MKKYSPQTIKVAERVLAQIADKCIETIPEGNCFSMNIWKHHDYPEGKIQIESLGNFTRSINLIDIYNEVM